MKEKIGIGMIGTGFARLTQIPAFRECEGAEVVSVASASRANAEKTATEFAIGHFTDDWRETVARDDVDLVSITTPPILHHEMALAAIENGKHVLCEKPMAMNAVEAEEMTRAAEEAGVLALIDHELRFLNGRRKAREMIRGGEIGDVLHCKSMFRNSSRGTPDQPWTWWSDEASGGGSLGAIASHAVDALRWLLDTEVKEVFCLLKTNITERKDRDGVLRPVTSDDEANLTFRFADGEYTRNATGTGSFSMVEAGKYDFDLKVFGSEGSITIGESGQLRIAKMGDPDWTSIEIELGEAPKGVRVGGWSIGFLEFAKGIVGAIRSGRTDVPDAATFRDGLAVQRVLDAARTSNATGRMVRL